jgi:hypothetical protein
MDSDESGSAGSAELILVQVAQNAAVVFGASRPDWLDVQPLVGASERDRSRLTAALSTAVAAGNVGAQMLPSIMAAQGVVQLSPATLAALQTLTPMVGAQGMNLGALVDTAGKIGHLVQWAPAVGTTAATFAASMGTSVALFAIQLQLRQISRNIERNLELTQDILDELRWKNDAELVALDDEIRQAVGEVDAIGAATAEIYGEIRGKKHLLEQARELLVRRISSYLDQLARAASAEARRTWVGDHADRCVVDMRALVRIHQDWFVFQAIRAAHVAEVDTSERGSDLVDRIRTEAQQENEVVGARVVKLADQLQRQLGLVEEASGRRIGRFGKAKNARTHAGELRAEIAEIVPVLSEDPKLSVPVAGIGHADTLDQGARILRWIVPSASRPVLAVECLIDGMSKAMLYVTADEFVLARTRKLLHDHEVEHRVPLSEVRYVLGQPDSQHLNVATSQGFFRLRVPEADEEAMAYATQLLRSLMQLPDDEVPATPEIADLPSRWRTADVQDRAVLNQS